MSLTSAKDVGLPRLRARLSVSHKAIHCGRRGCNAFLAYRVDYRGKPRILFEEGWLLNTDGVWFMTGRTADLMMKGRPAFRRSPLPSPDPSPDKFGRLVGHLPAVVRCYRCTRLQLLVAAELRVEPSSEEQDLPAIMRRYRPGKVAPPSDAS